MKMCKGRFSAETLALLEKAFEREGATAGETFGTYSCAVCGRTGLHAKEHEGAWYPESHDPPPRKRVNPSGKSGYYKSIRR
jgi:hypothetical protein